MGSETVDHLIGVLNEMIKKEQYILTALSNDPNNTELVEILTTVTTTREQIYQTIVGVLETDEGSFNSTVAIFGDQLAALKVMERSLNDTKSKLNEMQQNNVNKLRLIEINDYYGAQYEAQRNLMFYVTWLACHIVGLCVVKMFIPPLAAIMFPGPLFFPGCIIGSLFVGLTFYIIPLAMDIRFRDNMNFQEYAWGEFKNPSEVDLSNPNGTNPWVTPSTCNC